MDGYIKARTYDCTLKPDIIKDSHATAFYGLWKNTAEADGMTTEFLLYTPRDYFPWNRLVICICPKDRDPEVFANETKWMETAEKTSGGIREACAVLFFPLSDNGYEADKKLLNRTIDILADPNIDMIKYASDGLYMVGYGREADFAVRFALEHPAFFAGVCALGADDIDGSFIKEAAEKPCFVFSENRTFTIDGIVNKDARLPFWIINDGNGNEELLQYLKKVNRVTSEGKKNDIADIFEERHYFPDRDINTSNISRVWVSDIKGAGEAYRDEELTKRIWKDFFYPICRYMGDPMGSLRSYYTMREMGIRIYEEGMYHSAFDAEINRYFAVFTPSCYDGKTPLPLVVATHGFTGTFEMFARNSDFCSVAENHGFIVVFTQAGPNDIHSGHARWRTDRIQARPMMRSGGRTDTIEDLESEMDYFRKVVKRVTEDYAVDTERIYCTGHSNGSITTNAVAELLDDIFAAAVPVGAPAKQYETYEEMPLKERRMPFMDIENTYDRCPDPTDKDGNLYSELTYRLKMNGYDCDATGFLSSEDKMMIVREYINQDGIPAVKSITYKNACHAYQPVTSELVWDFVKDFRRTADGRSWYKGREIR